jgi:hypothetical protein
MFGGTDRITVSTDQLEQELLVNQAERARLCARDLEILEELDYRQVATADGCRSLSEWVAARLDMSTGTAKSVVRTMRRTVDRPDLREALESGVSFDRVEALSKIPDKIGLLEHLDVGGVEREAASRTRISAEDEQRTSDDQFLVLQPPWTNHGGNCGAGWKEWVEPSWTRSSPRWPTSCQPCPTEAEDPPPGGKRPP